MSDVDLNPLRIERSAGRPRRRRSGGGWFGRIVVLALLAGALWLFRAPLIAQVDKLRLPEVGVIRIEKTSRLAASSVSGTAANGYVVASVRAALSADTPGRIVEMNVTEGSVVRAGDVVARLYSDEYRAELRRAEADLAAAEAAVERARADREVAAREVERQQRTREATKAVLDDAAARLELAELTFTRAEKLVEQNVETRQRLDEVRAEELRARAGVTSAEASAQTAAASVSWAESGLVAAEAAVREAEARVPVLAAVRDGAQATLEKTEVRAPFDGIVVLKDAEVGEVVSPNSMGGNSRGSVVTMVDFSSLEVEVEVPETSLSKVEVDAPATIYLDAYPEKPYAGRVQRIWPTANRQKATVEVRVGFDEPDDRLRPEMGTRVVFAAAPDPEAAASAEDAEPTILVPDASVVRVDGRPGVFVLERDVVRFREIELGDNKSGRVLVLSGLDGGERIVVEPPAALGDGDRVRVRS